MALTHTIKTLAIILTGGLVTACASVPKDFTYRADDSQALIILAASQKNILNSYELTPVDLQTKTFSGKPVTIPFNATDVSATLGVEQGVMYAVKKVDPGAYAITRFYDSEYVAGFTYSQSNCFADDAPVYRVSAGTATLIPTPPLELRSGFATNAVALEVARSGFERLRINYPNITGDVTTKSPDQRIQFEEGEAGFIARNCPKPNQSFEINNQ